MISARKATLLPSYFTPSPSNPHRLFCGQLQSPHPIRAHLWWHPLGEISIEICLWLQGPLTWQVFAQVTYWSFLCSDSSLLQLHQPSCCSAPPRPPLQHISPTFENLCRCLSSQCLPHFVQVSCCGSSMFTVTMPGRFIHGAPPLGPVLPQPILFLVPSQDYILKPKYFVILTALLPAPGTMEVLDKFWLN